MKVNFIRDLLLFTVSSAKNTFCHKVTLLRHMQIKNNSTQTNIHVYDAMRVDEEEEVGRGNRHFT